MREPRPHEVLWATEALNRHIINPDLPQPGEGKLHAHWSAVGGHAIDDELLPGWRGVDALSKRRAANAVDNHESVDAARDAGNRWVFRDLLAAGLEPWSGVRQVWAAASPEAKHGVDVTETFDAGLASLRAHEAYLAGLGPDAPDPAEMLEGFARQTGTQMGVPMAAAFEVFPLQLL